MANEVWYYRYRLDDGRFWGATRNANDDLQCATTELEPLQYDDMSEELYWTGNQWQIQKL